MTWLRGLMAICLLSFLGCSNAPSDEHAKRFNEIEDAFADASTPEDYIRVAGDYQKLYEDGATSPAVLFNQGNAFARAERHGNAIACYRQALRLEPTNASISSNLRNSMTVTGATDLPPSWFHRILLWQDAIGYAPKFVLATVVIALASLLALVARRIRSSVAFRLSLIPGILAVVLTASAVFDWYRFEHVQSGTVVEAGVLPRTGNGESYEAAFNQPLAEGAEIVVDEERGDWLRITVPGTGSGWIPRGTTVLY